MADTENETKYKTIEKIIKIVCLVLLIFNFIIPALFLIQGDYDTDLILFFTLTAASYLLALYSTSYLVDLMDNKKARKIGFIVAMAIPYIALGIFILLWFLIKNSPDIMSIMFWFCLIISISAIFVIFKLIHHVMVTHHHAYSTKHRYSLILAGFSYFLVVAILLGLGLGFHDRAKRAYDPNCPGLLKMVSLDAKKGNKTNPPEKPASSSGSGAAGNQDGRDNGQEDDCGSFQEGPFRIWFEIDKTDILFNKSSYNVNLQNNKPYKDPDSHPSEKYPNSKKTQIELENGKSFAAIIKNICLCNNMGKEVFLVVEGLASFLKPKKEDNSTLSRKRALNTASKIFGLLNEYENQDQEKTPQTKGGILASMNKLNFGSSCDREECRQNEAKPNRHLKCHAALVWVKPCEESAKRIEYQISKLLPPVEDGLSLLDYVYFSIYTITTTAYGDIVPVTPQAKFVTILANIYEVVFLVIMFNIWMSRPEEKKEKKKKKKKEEEEEEKKKKEKEENTKGPTIGTKIKNLLRNKKQPREKNPE